MDIPRSATRSVGGREASLAARADRMRTRMLQAIAERAAPGTTAERILDRTLEVPWHAVIALGLFGSALLGVMNALAAKGRPEAYLALVVLPIGFLLLRRPLALGLLMVVAGVYLRALYLPIPESCDQMAVSRAALGVVAGGGNPYGFGYAESVPPGAPYPYGPLGMVTVLAGVPGEVLAAAGIMLILAFTRTLLTLGVMAAWTPVLELGNCGMNDQVPGLLVLAGLLLLERRRLSGAALLALSAAIKPYAFAWFPALIGFGGLAVAATLIGLSALLWAPLLIWGPDMYLRSVELARGIHPTPQNALNMPMLRILALPIAAVSLLIRNWTLAVLSGALIFVIVLFLDRWASLGYWYVVLPILGVIAERAIRRFGGRARARFAELRRDVRERPTGFDPPREGPLPAGEGASA
jgi:hypothetical protein